MLKRATILSAAVILSIASLAHAQTALRWKLQSGQKLAISITQTTESIVVYSGKKTATQIDLSMELTWRVISADDGKFRIEQSLDRLSVALDSPPAGRVQYDTAQQAKPTGSAKEIAAALDPLLATKLEITMTDRGEIVDAKPVQSSPPAAADPASSGPVPKESIQQLLRQPLAILPEKPVNQGGTWNTTSELETALGMATLTTTYRYTGPGDVDGHKLEQVAISAELKVAPSDKAKIKLKEHQQSGVVLFDATAGRVASTEQKQKLVTERPYRETTIVVTLDSKQTTKVVAVGDSPAAAQP